MKIVCQYFHVWPTYKGQSQTVGKRTSFKGQSQTAGKGKKKEKKRKRK